MSFGAKRRQKPSWTPADFERPGAKWLAENMQAFSFCDAEDQKSRAKASRKKPKRPDVSPGFWVDVFFERGGVWGRRLQKGVHHVGRL